MEVRRKEREEFKNRKILGKGEGKGEEREMEMKKGK